MPVLVPSGVLPVEDWVFFFTLPDSDCKKGSDVFLVVVDGEV